jgi:cyclopropane fatty-acyl-phospholipid synthase-like methyltransferase
MDRIIEPELMCAVDQVAGFSSAKREKSTDAFIKVYQMLCDTSKNRIIDLGCGPGQHLIKFAKEFPNTSIIGYDGSIEMVNFARQNVLLAGLGDRIEIRHALFKDIKFEDCDCILSSGTLHHAHYPLEFWEVVKFLSKDKTQIYVMDIVRPLDDIKLNSIVDELAPNENHYYKTDLYNSLRAAFTHKEIEEQLKIAELDLKILVTNHEKFGELVFLYRKTNAY